MSFNQRVRIPFQSCGWALCFPFPFMEAWLKFFKQKVVTQDIGFKYWGGCFWSINKVKNYFFMVFYLSVSLKKGGFK